MKRARPDNSREKLIDAAEVLVSREGVGTLTLDRVAAEAGVSKGGLLYHFPSKDALIEAMVERHLHSYTDALDQTLRGERTGPGRFTRAVVRAAFESSLQPPERERRTAAALLAAVVNRPALLAPVRDAYARWMEQASRDGLPAGQAVTVLAALDGLWFWNLLGLARLSPARARAMRQALEAMAHAPAPQPAEPQPKHRRRGDRLI